MRTRVSIFGALVAALAVVPSARAEHICTYMDGDVQVITNLCGKGHHKSKGKLHADPAFDAYRSGPVAPLDFEPNERTAKYDPYIKEACEKYHVPPALVRAIMNAESNFDPHAMSERGALGLMQLMPATHDTVSSGGDILDPRENILSGVQYLRVLINQFDGDFIRVVAAYNAGPSAVIAAGGVPQIPETQDYVHKVLRLYFHYKSEAQSASEASASR